MKESGVGNKAMLLLRRKINVAGMRVHVYLLCHTLDNVLHLFNSSGSREIERDAEMMRLQILGDPNLMQELERVRPYDLSVENHSSQFSYLGTTGTGKCRTF